MNMISKLALALLATTFAISAHADPINIELLPDGGGTPASIGGFDLTPFDEPAIPDAGCGPWNDGVTSTDSPISGQVNFQDQGGSPLCMSVQDPDWWQWDHGNVFTTGVPWVVLVMPDDVRAFTLFVGANITGRGWIEGEDADGHHKSARRPE